MTEPLLRFENLHVAFANADSRQPPFAAVKGLTFSINPGEVVALVGESGSGKSVSAMSILRLLPQPPALYPQGGISFAGEEILTMSNQRLRQVRGGEIGMVFQEPMSALNPTWTVGNQVSEALELHTTLDAKARRARVIELFAQVGIPNPAERFTAYPHELSGGLRQRVCIAMALACRPKLLIADEPTTALDVTIQAQILDLLRRLRHELGMAVLFITHDLGVVGEFADRVVVMRQGVQVEDGTVAEVFRAPKHPYIKALIACRPSLARRGERLPTVEDLMADSASAAAPAV